MKSCVEFLSWWELYNIRNLINSLCLSAHKISLKRIIPHRIFVYQGRQEYFDTMVIPLSNDQLLVDALAKLTNDVQTVTVATESDTLCV